MHSFLSRLLDVAVASGGDSSGGGSGSGSGAAEGVSVGSVAGSSGGDSGGDSSEDPDGPILDVSTASSDPMTQVCG